MAIRRDDFIIAGVFRDRESADHAFDAVSKNGISADSVSVLMKDETRNRFYGAGGGTETEPLHERRRTAEGAGIGGAVGAGLGAVLAAVLAAGAPITIPGLLIAGPLAGALTGAGAGAVGGGFVGALIGAGLKENVAEDYKHDVEKGHIVLAVTTHDETTAHNIEKEWKKYGDKVRRDDLPAEAPRRTA